MPQGQAWLKSAVHRVTKDVGKEHRHLLALAFKGSLRGENLLGDVFRRVQIGRWGLTRRSARLEASATLPTELLSGRIAGTTFPAQDRVAGAAFAAEFHLDGVFVTALRAPHRSASEQQGVRKRQEPSGTCKGQQGKCRLSDRT